MGCIVAYRGGRKLISKKRALFQGRREGSQSKMENGKDKGRDRRGCASILKTDQLEEQGHEDHVSAAIRLR